MKKWLFLYAFLHFSINIYSQKDISLNFDLKDFLITVSDGCYRIDTNLPDRRRAGDGASPHLPYFPCRVLLPSEVVKVDYQLDFTKELIASGVDIEANPKSLLRLDGLAQNSKMIKASRSVYSPLVDNGIVQVDGCKYLFLKVTPFIYNSKERNLYFVSSLKIRFPSLPIMMSSDNLEKRKRNKIPLKILNRFVNAEDYSLFCSPQNLELGDRTTSLLTNINTIQSQLIMHYVNKVDFLIITSDSLVNSFQQLKLRKRQKGLRAEIVPTSIIYSAYPSGTNQEKVKRFINDIGMYNMVSYGPYYGPNKFVLLGGDNSIVPVYYSNFFYDGTQMENAPADLYYACPNWDEMGQSQNQFDHYGITPYVFLTRLPIRTSQQVLDYTNKSIIYESEGWNNNKILFAANQIYGYYDGVSDAHYLSDKLASYISSDAQLQRLYDTGGDFQFNISATNLFNVIEDGYAVIHELSHGSYDRWDTGTYDYTCTHASNQRNDYYSLIVTGACYTNAFDMQDIDPCLSEAFLRNPNGGAVTYFGSSRLGFGGDDTHSIYSELMFSDLFDYFFLTHLYVNDAISDPEPFSFGSICTSAKQDLIEESNNNLPDDIDAQGYRSLQYAINPVGDPELQMYTDFAGCFSLSELPIITIYPGEGITIEAREPECLVRILPDDDSEPLRTVLTYQGETITYNTTSNCNIALIKKNRKPELIRAIVSPLALITPLSLDVQNVNSNQFRVSLSIADETNRCIDLPTNVDWLLEVNDVWGARKLKIEVSDEYYIIDTSSWSKGMYILKATIGEKVISSKIVIK